MAFLPDLDHCTLFVAGHTGLVGSSLLRRWSAIPTLQLRIASHAECDLIDPHAVQKLMDHLRPQVVVAAAGRVGGIRANSEFPAEFIHQNLMIEANLIHAAWKNGVRRFLNFGSACMYPRDCLQPMPIEALMTGPVESTSEPYAMAKLAGLSLARSYRKQYGFSCITCIPCNLYGPGETFDTHRSHVVPAMIRRFHEASERGDRDITLWGSGHAQREFLFIDDLAEAVDLLLRKYDAPEPINIGSGAVCTIRDLAETVATMTGFSGNLRWDSSKPDGSTAKSLESSTLRRLGWTPRTSLKEGLQRTYDWYLNHFRSA